MAVQNGYNLNQWSVTEMHLKRLLFAYFGHFSYNVLYYTEAFDIKSNSWNLLIEAMISFLLKIEKIPKTRGIIP